MGCTNTKLKKAKVFNLHTKEHRTVTSSGLQTQFDSVTNFQIFEKAPVEHEKYTLLRTSNTYPPELIQELQEPQPEKFQQKSYANNPVILLPPKEAEVPDFSFKLSHSQSMEGQNNPVVNTDSVLQNNLDVNHIQRTNTRNPTGTFPGLSNFALENRSLANSNVFNEAQHNIEPNVPQHNEDINHTHKGLSGLAFSFVNPQLSHVHQPTIFYTGNGEGLGSSNVASSSIFGSKNNEEGKVLETIKEGQGGSLSMLDEEQEKGKASAESYPIAGGSTNIYSRESVTSLTNICPDENKKATLTRKFTSNLIEVVKKDSESSRDELPKLKKKDTITSLNSLDMEDSQKKELSRKFTANLIHLVKPVNSMKLTSTKSMIVPVKEEIPSVNSLCFNPKSKALSTPNFNLNFKYFPDPVPIPTILEPEKPKIDLDISEIKEEKVPEKSMDFSAFDISRDSDRTPPYKQNHLQVITKKEAPNSPFLACLNSSYQGQLDTSAMFDKSRLALDNNISRIDLDKYSINVEVCDENDIKDNNILSPKAAANPSPGRKHLNIGHTRKSKTEKEIRSAVLDIPTEYDTTTQPKSPNTAREDVMPRTKSYTELNGMKRRLLSTDFGRQMPTDLNRTTPSVIETSRVDKSVDHEGQKKINQYLLIKELGKGGFGKVKLAIHCDHKQQYAVKIANKNKLKRKLFSKSKNAYTQLAKEVAILKKMDHPNIVRLFEVIDDPDHNNLYLVMEYIKKGAVLSKNYWKDEKAKTEEFKLNMEENGQRKENRLTEEKAKKYFRHLILALDYLHNTIGIIHRDIKPENLLIGADDTLKVSDFGISEIMEDGNDLLQTNAGTKSYLAPEAWKDYKFNGKPADIWAAGGTLYYFLFGKPPFQSFNGAEDLKKKILEDEVKFPEEIELSPGVVNLIQACLVKDPRNRITLEEIMVDPWLTDNGANPLEHNLSSEFGPSEDDVEKAFTKISFMAVVYVTATLKKAHKAKEKVKSKKSQEFLQP